MLQKSAEIVLRNGSLKKAPMSLDNGDPGPPGRRFSWGDAARARNRIALSRDHGSFFEAPIHSGRTRITRIERVSTKLRRRTRGYSHCTRDPPRYWAAPPKAASLPKREQRVVTRPAMPHQHWIDVTLVQVPNPAIPSDGLLAARCRRSDWCSTMPTGTIPEQQRHTRISRSRPHAIGIMCGPIENDLSLAASARLMPVIASPLARKSAQNRPDLLKADGRKQGLEIFVEADAAAVVGRMPARS